MAEDEIDIHTLYMKIEDQVKVLSNSHRNEAGSVSRKELMADFLRDVARYYEYGSELLEHLAQLFAPAELLQFLEASQVPRPLTIRTNTLKTKRRELAQYLIQRGINLDPVGEWSKVGLKIIDSQVPIGATPEYLAGLYMLQSAASFLPVMALAPQPGEKVLDLAAAPGGKTTHIAQLMKNTGVLFANDISEDRLTGVRGNVQRLGVTNCIITNFDGRRFPQVMGGFDRVLIDAPCSGLGVIAKDQSIKTHRTLDDIKKTAHLQKELLLAAIDACNARSRTGGFIVYSTCSISVEENEEVIQYALNNRRVKIVETGLPIGENGFPKFRGKVFDAKMNRCKRVYPHVHNMDGFFVAKLKKCDNELPEGASKPHTGEKRPRLREKGKRKVERVPDLVPLDEDQEEEQSVPQGKTHTKTQDSATERKGDDDTQPAKPRKAATKSATPRAETEQTTTTIEPSHSDTQPSLIPVKKHKSTPIPEPESSPPSKRRKTPSKS